MTEIDKLLGNKPNTPRKEGINRWLAESMQEPRASTSHVEYSHSTQRKGSISANFNTPCTIQ